jgi:aryl-alcohol dehydrogenase-like predicted oxidoreductase
MHRWFVTSTIVGATNLNQLKENINTWNINLSEEILQEIDKLHLTMTNPAP